MPSTITDRLNGLTTSVAVKPPCVAVSSTNVTLAGLQIIGSVALAADDRVLLIGQTDDTENGIYIADSGDWTRARDFDGPRDAVQGTLVLVANQFTEGAFYELTSDDPVSFGTSSITFQLRDAPNVVYDLEQSEVDEGVTPIRYNFIVGDVRRYCTAAETNHSAAFTAANAVSGVIYAPAGTWNVDHFLMDIDGRKLRTDGFATIIHQRTGNLNRRAIEVCASNIVIEDIKVTGNIATDTGEQQHAILVNGNHPTEADRDITNIHIGNVWAQDIRGDALYLGAPVGSTARNITFGVVRGTNIYRNVVSIVGASHVDGIGITTDGGCGYETFDIEPDGAGESTDINIGFIRGGNLQCAPPVSVARRIHIGTADLDPAFQPNSTPGYSEGGSNYAKQIRTAVNLRNTVGFRIGYLKVRDHSYFALEYIFNPGEQRGQNISIGYLDSSGVGAGESSINALLNLGQVESFTLDDGNVALGAVGDYVMVGSSATKDNKFTVNRLTLDGTLVRFCSKSKFSNIFANHANAVNTIRDCDDSVLEASDITAPNFITNTTGLTVLSSKVTCSGTYIGGTSNNLSFINCSGGLASVLAGSATYDPPSLTTGLQATTTVTATGAAVGDIARASFSKALQGIQLSAEVSAANTVSCTFKNGTAGTLDLASGTLRVRVEKV